jgi:hypothetical protein
LPEFFIIQYVAPQHQAGAATTAAGNQDLLLRRNARFACIQALTE